MGSTSATARPGGRTARVRTQVLNAAGDLLVERGFDQLDLAEIAQRAQVGKTTIYRRWGSVTRLIGDLLSDMAEQSVPRAATGSLRGDLRANAELVARTLADPRQGRLFRAVIAASLCDAGAAEALRLFYRVRVQEWSGCVEDAIDRGELAPDTDCSAVVRAVSAPLYYRMLTTDLPLDLVAAHQAADAAWVAARSGVLGSAGASSSTAAARACHPRLTTPTSPGHP